jgi:hypothetical protein
VRSIARLLYLHLFGAAGLRWLSACGIATLAGTLVANIYHPEWLPLPLVAVIGLGAVFAGTALMPMIVGRMSRGSWTVMVPYARIKLLASALLTVVLVSLPVLMWIVAGVGQSWAPVGPHFHLDPQLAAAIHAQNIALAWASWLGTFNLFTWLYVIVWMVTSQRTAGGLFRALLLFALILYAPTRDIARLDARVTEYAVQAVGTWVLFAVLFLWWPRWRLSGGRVIARLGASGGRAPLPRTRVTGRATDLVLGMAQPWLMAGAQALPVLLAARISDYFPGGWLYCLVLFSVSSAATAGQAAVRSRALWLRTGWSRAELYRQVEWSFWHHNFIVLAVLLAVMVGVGTYFELSPRLLITGVPLLVLGTTLGTYLGLIVTRGMRWLETILGVVVMLALMAGAVLADRAQLIELIALLSSLAVLALVFRAVARRRWDAIDWMASRPERAIRVRAAS